MDFTFLQCNGDEDDDYKIETPRWILKLGSTDWRTKIYAEKRCIKLVDLGRYQDGESIREEFYL